MSDDITIIMTSVPVNHTSDLKSTHNLDLREKSKLRASYFGR